MLCLLLCLSVCLSVCVSVSDCACSVSCVACRFIRSVAMLLVSTQHRLSQLDNLSSQYLCVRLCLPLDHLRHCILFFCQHHPRSLLKQFESDKFTSYDITVGHQSNSQLILLIRLILVNCVALNFHSSISGTVHRVMCTDAWRSTTDKL